MMTQESVQPAAVQAASPQVKANAERERRRAARRRQHFFYLALLGVAMVAPMLVYPVFLMKLLCFALFACAFNLLLGYAGLLSFGHAAFFACGGYITGYMLSTYSGLNTELGLSPAPWLPRCWGWSSAFWRSAGRGSISR